MPEWDVFLSYCGKDLGKAEAIRRDLEAAGLSIWYDRSAIKFGRRIREEIEEGIRNSRLFLVLISQYSLRSPWVLNELDAGMLRELDTRRCFVLPALLGRVTHSDLPPDIRGKKYIDLRYRFESRYLEQRAAIIKALSKISGSAGVESDGGLKPTSPDKLSAVAIESARMRVISSLGSLLNENAALGSESAVERAAGSVFLNSALPSILAHHRHSQPALMLFDVDGLSAINGRFGVGIGTQIIRRISEELKNINEITYTGRCGDDTFYAVIECGSDAEELASRIHGVIREVDWSRIAPGLYVTVSSGLAWAFEDEDAPDWLIRAVHGMLDAKNRGRDIAAPAPRYVKQEWSRDPGRYFSGWEPDW